MAAAAPAPGSNPNSKQKKKRHAQPVCDDNFDTRKPPQGIPFGSIEAAREARPPNRFPKKVKRPSKVYPKDAKPKAIQFPFIAATDSAERILHASTEEHEGPGNTMGKIKVAHQKLIFPGWLIELSDFVLEILMNVKEILATGKKLCDIVDDVFEELEQLALGVKLEDVIECIRRTSTLEGGWDFPRFLFAIADPHYGREKGVFTDPVPYNGDCDNAEGDTEGNGNTKPKKPQLTREEIIERLHQPYKFGKKPDIWPFDMKEIDKEMEEEETGHLHHDTKEHINPLGVDETGYTQKEKVFYSGLLVFEMYKTIKELEQLYFQNATIPEPEDKLIRLQHQRGFGGESLGTKKHNFAEWDRPLPKLPKKSPYMSDIPFVATRWKIQQPNQIERAQERRRTLTVLQPLHLMVHAPPALKEPIKVTENNLRIKKAMEYLASKGNVVAMLPAAHCIVHLSDTFLEKLEQVNINALKGPPPPDPRPNDDMAAILNLSKGLFKLHGVPPQIAKMDNMVNYNTALCLRKICRHIRKEHWDFIQERKVVFREKAWKLMHVERIPCGHLKESFIYSFDTYLPFKSYLPTTYNATPL